MFLIVTTSALQESEGGGLQSAQSEADLSECDETEEVRSAGVMNSFLSLFEVTAYHK